MDRINDILNSVNESFAVQKTYKGKKRSELKDSDFLFPQTRSFPIVTPQDIPDAISNFGRMKGKMSYDAFLKKLYNMAKRKGPEFIAALPKASKDKLNLKSKSYIGNLDDDLMTPSETNYFELDRVNLANLKPGDMVKNINQSCKHYGSEGYVDDVSELPDYMGQVVRYTTINAGPTWSMGEKLVKTPNQLMLMRNIGINEYKEEFLGMSISSIKAIFAHAQNILTALEDNQKKDTVSKNLTESWLQGKIAVTEENMRSVHDFVMFSEEETDTDDSGATVEPVDPKKKRHKLTVKDLPTSRFYYRKDPVPDAQDPQNKDTEDDNTPYMDDFSGVWAKKQPGLWENIRKKKEREGKSYKPSKMGEKDRPSTEQWKKLTKKKDNS